MELQEEIQPFIKANCLTQACLHRIGENLSGGILVCTFAEEYRIHYANSQFLDYLGYSWEELQRFTGGGYRNLIHPHDREDVDRQIKRVYSAGESASLNYRIQKHDGRVVYLRDLSKKAFFEDGTPIRISICINTTRQVALQQELKVKNREFAFLMGSLPCGICKTQLDENFSICYANRFFYQLMGYSDETDPQHTPLNAKSIVYPGDFDRVSETIRENLRQGTCFFELEHRLIHRSQRILWGLIRCRFDPEAPNLLTCILLDITQRRQIEDELRVSEEENRIAFELTDKEMYLYEVDSKTLTLSQKAADTLGLPAELKNVPYSLVAQGRIAQESTADFIAFYEAILKGVPTGSLVVKQKKQNDTFGWFSAKYSLIFHKNGAPRRAVISSEDITEKREKELAYQKWSQYFAVQQAGCIGYYEYNLTKDLLDETQPRRCGRLPRHIKTFTGAVHYVAANLISQEHLRDYLCTFDREKLLVHFYSGEKETRLEHRRKREDGSCFWTLGIVQLIADPYTNDVKAFILIQDIDEKKQEELTRKSLLECDTLTGLLNRRTLVKKISSILNENGSYQRHAFIMLDIDRFKQLNDTYGHIYGDQVLKDIAVVLKNNLRREDLCGRLGGDEFILFLNDISGQFKLESRLAEICQAIFRQPGDNTSVSASLGVACSPDDGNTFEELYRKADIALYQAKRLGKNQYAIYLPEMER